MLVFVMELPNLSSCYRAYGRRSHHDYIRCVSVASTNFNLIVFIQIIHHHQHQCLTLSVLSWALSLLSTTIFITQAWSYLYL